MHLPILLRSPLTCASCRRLDLLFLGLGRSLILATFSTIRIRHLLVTPTALVCRVILFGHIGVGVGLKVLVEALVIFIG